MRMAVQLSSEMDGERPRVLPLAYDSWAELYNGNLNGYHCTE